MARAAGLLVVAAAAALLVLWLAGVLRRPVQAPPAGGQGGGQAPGAASGAGAAAAGAGGQGSGNGAGGVPGVSSPPSTPIAPPFTPHQQAQAGLEARRQPLYRWINATGGQVLLDVRPAPGDGATLEILARDQNTAVFNLLMRAGLGAQAYPYGFRRIRFEIASNSEPPVYSDYAEATPDSSGAWQVYLK